MTQLKIATFNVENLFSRAKVLNLYNHKTGTDKLSLVADLQTELARDVYDKSTIIDLYAQVKDYVKFNVMSCAPNVSHYIVYFSTSLNSYVVIPNGREDWFGFLEFKRNSFDDVSQKNTARVIRDIDADILCIIEVESRPVLNWLNSDRLYRLYPYNILVDGNDSRGIDVGLYSKLEITNIRTNIFDGPANSRTFPRDCLEVEVKTESGDSVFVLVNHLTSKFGWDTAATDQRRKKQANRISQILNERYDLVNQYVIVAGDLNDTPDRPPLQPLLATPNLRDVLKLQFPNEPAKRWTYHYEDNEQIDYLLVSEKLADKFSKSGVWRKGMAHVDDYSNGEISPYNSVTSWRNAASDHGAVWAVFNM